MEVNLSIKVTLYKAKSMCISSPSWRLVVPTVANLVKVFIFVVYHTVHGASIIFLGQFFGRPVRV